MSELEDLPSWAGRLTREVTAPATPDETDTARAEGADPAPGEAATSPTPPTPPTEPAEPIEPIEPLGERPGLAPRAAVQVPEPPAAPEFPRAESAPIDEKAEQNPVAEEVATPGPATQELTTPVIGASPVIERVAPAAASQNAPAAQAPLATAEPVTGLPSGVSTARRRSPLRAILFTLIGLAVLAGAGYGGYLLANRSSSDETATTGGDADEAVVPDSPSTSEAASETAAGAVDGEADGTATDAAGGTDAAATGDDTADGDDAAAGADDGSAQQTVKVEVDGAGASGTATGATDGDAPMNDGDRRAYFRGGKVYLTGAVPSPEIAEIIVQKAARVVGPDNVVNEYTIDPNTTINPGDSAPLYVEDVILFDFNSVEVATPFVPILDLGVLLLRQNPQASITVVTRTDAVGAESVNLDVSEKRADAVINYWLSKGVDRDQIKTDPRGEEGASEDDDAETAARQRRAEFIITGLLD